MELTHIRIKAPANRQPIKLFPIGDVHLFAAACDIEHFRRTVQLVRDDPNAYWIHMGDGPDAIMPTDPRWSWSGMDWARVGMLNGRPSPDNLSVEIRDSMAREFDPIADKCIGWHIGNHEKVFTKHYFMDLGRHFASRYDVPYLDYEALIGLEVEVREGRGHPHLWRQTIFSEHGAKGGGTDGNAINNLLTRGNEFDADVYLKGHVHKRAFVHKSSLAIAKAHGQSVLKRKDRLFVLTGTYLKGYVVGDTTYGEYKGYPPNEIGGTVLILDAHAERIHAMNVEALDAIGR